MEERLKKLKLALVVQWGELAERLGISRSMLDKVRSGEREPGPILERAIIEAERAAGISAPILAREHGETLAKTPISPTTGKGASDRFQRLEKLLEEASRELAELKKKLGEE